jgi:hypothetical protein
LRQLEAFPIRRQGEVGPCHLGHQSDLGATPGLIGGQILLQRLLGKTADAPEKVQFPRGDAQIDAVVARGAGLSRLDEIDGTARPSPAALGVDRGIQLAALDAVHPPRPFHIQGRQAQIAVIFQGHADKLSQAFVGEEFPPAQVASEWSIRRQLAVGRADGPLGGHRGCRPLVFGGQGATAEDESGTAGGQQDRLTHGLLLRMRPQQWRLRVFSACPAL